MAVKLKLARHGSKNKPIYTLVAAESRFSRDGRFLKKLGIYEPGKLEGSKLTVTDPESLKEYLSCGAKPTETVRRLLRVLESIS